MTTCQLPCVRRDFLPITAAGDARHRYGAYLRVYFEHWQEMMAVDTNGAAEGGGGSFFEWLDHGACCAGAVVLARSSLASARSRRSSAQTAQLNEPLWRRRQIRDRSCEIPFAWSILHVATACLGAQAGAGLSLEECPRRKLEQACVHYCTRSERRWLVSLRVCVLLMSVGRCACAFLSYVVCQLVVVVDAVPAATPTALLVLFPLSFLCAAVAIPQVCSAVGQLGT